VDGGTGTELDRCHYSCIQSRQDRLEGSMHTTTEHGPGSATNVHATMFDHAARTDAYGRTANDVYATNDATTHGTDANGCATANDAPNAAKYETANDDQSTS